MTFAYRRALQPFESFDGTQYPKSHADRLQSAKLDNKLQSGSGRHPTIAAACGLDSTRPDLNFVPCLPYIPRYIPRADFMLQLHLSAACSFLPCRAALPVPACLSAPASPVSIPFRLRISFCSDWQRLVCAYSVLLLFFPPSVALIRQPHTSSDCTRLLLSWFLVGALSLWSCLA